jgi:hypothetical protein
VLASAREFNLSEEEEAHDLLRSDIRFGSIDKKNDSERAADTYRRTYPNRFYTESFFSLFGLNTYRKESMQAMALLVQTVVTRNVFSLLFHISSFVPHT